MDFCIVYFITKALIAVWFYVKLLLHRIADVFAMSTFCARLHQLTEQFVCLFRSKKCFEKASDVEEIQSCIISDNRSENFR